MPIKHSFMAVTTNFELEFVLDQYIRTYPNSVVQSCEVVYKIENEFHQSTKTYIVVFTRRSKSEHSPSVWELIDSYCKLNGKFAVANPVNQIFPDLAKGGSLAHVAGIIEASE